MKSINKQTTNNKKTDNKKTTNNKKIDSKKTTKNKKVDNKKVIKQDIKIENKSANFKTIINILIITIILILSIISVIFNIILYEKINVIEKSEYKIDENIVFYGDSITSKYEIEKFFPYNRIINSGISGNEATDLIERIESDVYKYNPSKVFILIGINDLNHDVDKEEILNNIQTIITGIKINRKLCKIYIQSVYPINKDYMEEKDYDFNEELTNDDIIEFNKEIKKLASKNNITYIDVYDSLIDKDGNLNEKYTKEGLHLNDVGYLKVSNVLEKYVKEK